MKAPDAQNVILDLGSETGMERVGSPIVLHLGLLMNVLLVNKGITS